MMMASSEVENNGVLLDQIDSALSLWGDGISVTDIEEESHLKLSSFQEMYDVYMDDQVSEFFNDEEISYDLTFGESVWRSNILGDKKLLEAILFSKIFENSSEFDTNRADCVGKLVWVVKEEVSTSLLYLISSSKIIYWMLLSEIQEIRSKAQKLWGGLFKEKVRNNLLEVVRMPVIQDWSKYVSDVQSSFDAAPSSALSDANPLKYPLTEELKKIFLEELSCFELDPVIKQKFVFDLKVMPDKDITYWRERLDHLRSSSSVASSQEIPQRMSQAVADLEKLVHEKYAETSTLAETIPKLKELITDRSDRTVDIKLNAEKLQQLVDSMSSLAKSVDGHRTSLAKMKDQLSATTKTESHHLQEIIFQLKIDLMESTDCNLKISHSSLEGKLNELQAAISDLKASIQDKKTGLPAMNRQLLLHENNISTQLDPLRKTVDSVKFGDIDIKQYLHLICEHFQIYVPVNIR